MYGREGKLQYTLYFQLTKYNMKVKKRKKKRKAGKQGEENEGEPKVIERARLTERL
jgi:hypothetical protein